jgi:hypothetical protein
MNVSAKSSFCLLVENARTMLTTEQPVEAEIMINSLRLCFLIAKYAPSQLERTQCVKPILALCWPLLIATPASVPTQLRVCAAMTAAHTAFGLELDFPARSAQQLFAHLLYVKDARSSSLDALRVLIPCMHLHEQPLMGPAAPEWVRRVDEMLEAADSCDDNNTAQWCLEVVDGSKSAFLQHGGHRGAHLVLWAAGAATYVPPGTIPVEPLVSGVCKKRSHSPCQSELEGICVKRVSKAQ